MKKLMVACVLACLAVSALATDVLFWQVNPSEIAADVGPYDEACLYYMIGEGGEPTLIGQQVFDKQQNPGGSAPELDVMPHTYETFDIAGLSGTGAKFYMELGRWNADAGVMDTVGQTEFFGYSDISKYLTTWKGTGGSEIPTQGAWNPSSSFSAVPEPTGGLLVLLGAAALALRRRRA